MTRVSNDKIGSRRANIAAACRVAVRMVETDRGQDAALQFLLDVLGPLLDTKITLVLKPVGDAMPSAHSITGAQRRTTATSGWSDDGCSLPIRSDDGQAIGDLRFPGLDQNCLGTDTEKALASVARTVATIVAKTS